MFSSDPAGALRHSTAVVDAAADRSPSRVLADTLIVRSWALLELGQYPEAAEAARRCLAVACEVGYPDGEMMALAFLAGAATAAGDPGEAVRLYRTPAARSRQAHAKAPTACRPQRPEHPNLRPRGDERQNASTHAEGGYFACPVSAGSAEHDWRGRGTLRPEVPGIQDHEGQASSSQPGREGNALIMSRSAPHQARRQGRERAAASRRRTGGA
jgi:hypothetical protein